MFVAAVLSFDAAIGLCWDGCVAAALSFVCPSACAVVVCVCVCLYLHAHHRHLYLNVQPS